MIEQYFEQLDQHLLLFINGMNAPWLDQTMFAITKMWVFIPLFLLWIYFTFKLLKAKGFLLFGICLGLTILFADQTANAFKNNVERYRPTHNLVIGQEVHIVNDYHGGQYGFFSGHAATTFGIATLLFLTFRRKKSWIKHTFFPFAILASYSRMYLGVHYPFDIFCGMLTGILYGFLAFQLLSVLLKKYSIPME